MWGPQLFFMFFTENEPKAECSKRDDKFTYHFCLFVNMGHVSHRPGHHTRVARAETAQSVCHRTGRGVTADNIRAQSCPLEITSDIPLKWARPGRPRSNVFWLSREQLKAVLLWSTWAKHITAPHPPPSLNEHGREWKEKWGECYQFGSASRASGEKWEGMIGTSTPPSHTHTQTHTHSPCCPPSHPSIFLGLVAQTQQDKSSHWAIPKTQIYPFCSMSWADWESMALSLWRL